MYPIFIKNIEKQETEIKLDIIIPAFLLKANGDKQFWSNVVTSGEYALDVVTTLSGVGNIAKFRHLTKLVKLAEGVSTANKVVKTANILRYVKGAAGVVELTSGSVSLMLKITEARESEFGESLSKILFYLELITLSGELTASIKLGLKKSAKEAIESSNGTVRKANRELFDELYRIVGIDEIGRTILKVGNIENLGSQGNKVLLKLLDDAENEVGTLIRTFGDKGRKLLYELEIAGKSYPISSSTELLNTQIAKKFELPVAHGENILYADFNIPTNVTDNYSGLGNIMLDDTLAFYLKNPKFGKVDGIFGVWVQNPSYYNEYGGLSLNLKKFWEAMSRNKNDIEKSAFETFTGGWANNNMFKKIWFDQINTPITENQVIIKFLK